jgi:hypothetical protein
VLCCVMCVVLWLCLIVAPLPPGIKSFAVNNNKKNYGCLVTSADRRISLDR